MSHFLYDNATTFAEKHSLSMDARLGRLEIHAFQQHPEIYRWFGADGAATERARRRPRSLVTRAWDGIAITGTLIGLAAPVLGLAAIAALGGNRFGFNPLRPEIAFPLGGVAYLVTAVTQVVVLVVWLFLGARWSGLLAGTVGVTLVLSALGVVSISNTTGPDGYPEGAAWLPAAIIAALVSLASLIVMFTRFRVRRPSDAPTLDRPEEGVEGPSAADGIAALAVEEREAIRDDRQRALAVLHERGLLDDATFERARSSPLGTLYLLDRVPEAGGA